MRKVLVFFNGLSGVSESQEAGLDYSSINFYHSDDGYLRNYPGRIDYFERDKGNPPQTEGWGDPPAYSTFTRVKSFTDKTGVEHLVVVNKMDVQVVEGNTTKTIATLSGSNISGSAYPCLFEHEGKLIIVNDGDVPMLWDGIDGVTPLGVSEVPSAPNLTKAGNELQSNTNFTTDPKLDANYWYHYLDGPNPGPPGIATNKDSSGTYIRGKYSIVVQFVDKYGNKGAASPPSPVVEILPTTSPETWRYYGLQADWVPPTKDPHIHYVIQGRTANINKDDADGGASPNVFYEETYIEGTTMHRRWQRLSDSSLIGRNPIDLEVRGPPNASFGASFGGRIYLVDVDGTVWPSDLVYFGQFRASSSFRTYSRPTAVVPAGDRLFIICETSSEVWYESENGPALLEQDIENGSKYGNTFVAVGDGTVFGLWNNGFGFYDGRQHKYIKAPYYVQNVYLNGGTIRSAKKIADWYYLPVVYESESDKNNVLIKYNFSTGQWFILSETVNDIDMWNEEIIGVDDSIYILYRGISYPPSTIQTTGIMSVSSDNSVPVLDARILMEASANVTANVEIEAETKLTNVDGNVWTHPSMSDSVSNREPYPYWGDSASAPYPYGADWQAPGDCWFKISFDKPVPGIYHRFRFDFSGGHSVKVRALEITYGTPIHAESL